jgi:hypothetical protein
MNDIAVHAPFAMSLYFLYRGIHSRRALDFALSGIGFGFVLWMDFNKLSMVYIPVMGVIFLYLFVIRWRFWRSAYPLLLVFLLGILVVMVPVLFTYASHNALLLPDHLGKCFIFRESSSQPVSEMNNTTNKVLFLVDQVKYSLFGLNHYHDTSPFFWIDERRPMLCSLTSVFFFIGLAYSLWRWKKPPYGIVLIWWLVCLLANILSSIPPLAHRLLLCMCPTYLLAAIGIMKTGQMLARFFKARQKQVSASLVFIILVSISYTNIQACFIPFNYPLGWKETTHTGKLMYTWGHDHDIYYLGAPYYYADGHGAIIFSSQLASLSAVNVRDVFQVVPLEKPATRDVVFIFSLLRFNDFFYIQQIYPNGEMWEWYDEAWDSTYLRAYVVPKETINHPVIDTRW